MERADARALPLRDREETDGGSTVMEECNEIGKMSLPRQWCSSPEFRAFPAQGNLENERVHSSMLHLMQGVVPLLLSKVIVRPYWK